MRKHVPRSLIAGIVVMGLLVVFVLPASARCNHGHHSGGSSSGTPSSGTDRASTQGSGIHNRHLQQDHQRQRQELRAKMARDHTRLHGLEKVRRALRGEIGGMLDEPLAGFDTSSWYEGTRRLLNVEPGEAIPGQQGLADYSGNDTDIGGSGYIADVSGDDVDIGGSGYIDFSGDDLEMGETGMDENGAFFSPIEFSDGPIKANSTSGSEGTSLETDDVIMRAGDDARDDGDFEHVEGDTSSHTDLDVPKGGGILVGGITANPGKTDQQSNRTGEKSELSMIPEDNVMIGNDTTLEMENRMFNADFPFTNLAWPSLGLPNGPIEGNLQPSSGSAESSGRE